jgi:antitoxin FitA
MAAVTIRNLPEATHRALKARAARHGRSTEAEIREIIESAVRPANRVRLGSRLAELGRKYSGVELSIERDQSPTPPVDLE